MRAISKDSDTASTEAPHERLDRGTRLRVETELEATLRRRQPHEAAVAAALRVLWPTSAALRDAGRDAFALLLRRRSVDRPLFAGLVRALADDHDARSTQLLASALDDDTAAEWGALAAASFSRAKLLAPLLGKRAQSPKVRLAFLAEMARVLRGETGGARLAAFAPRLKELTRLEILKECIVPLSRRALEPAHELGEGLLIVASAERHLGRWLALGEVATRAGDAGFRVRAREMVRGGPASSRGAWALVEWALDRVAGVSAVVPPVRLTAELLSRLSDRPSAERDMSFLFRLAEAGFDGCVPMLQKLAASPHDDAQRVRALAELGRRGRGECLEQLRVLGSGEGSGVVRGLAVAALHDAGAVDEARELAAELVLSKELSASLWGSVVRLRSDAVTGDSPRVSSRLLDEVRLRWIEHGEVEA